MIPQHAPERDRTQRSALALEPKRGRKIEVHSGTWKIRRAVAATVLNVRHQLARLKGEGPLTRQLRTPPCRSSISI
jgi:hypothetical protein